MSMVRYTDFYSVFKGCQSGVFRNESELKQAFVEALKEELRRSICNRYLVDNWLAPALEETLRKGRADIRVSNLVIEVEPPGAGLRGGREQLHRYMRELYEQVGGAVPVYGLVTDGIEAELYELQAGGAIVLKSSGDMPTVSGDALALFCSQHKIPVTRVEDLVVLFGV